MMHGRTCSSHSLSIDRMATRSFPNRQLTRNNNSKRSNGIPSMDRWMDGLPVKVSVSTAAAQSLSPSRKAPPATSRHSAGTHSPLAVIWTLAVHCWSLLVNSMELIFSCCCGNLCSGDKSPLRDCRIKLHKIVVIIIRRSLIFMWLRDFIACPSFARNDIVRQS